MNEPKEKDYGFTDAHGWPDWESEYKFLKTYRTWFNLQSKPKRLPGRRRDSPIHPSWADYVNHFNPTDPTRSQGAFCRWSGIRSSSLSAAKRKPITDRMELKISEWLEMLWIGDGEGLDGSWNTNADRVKKEVESE